jgi:type VI secretion system secreted protein Hcp
MAVDMFIEIDGIPGESQKEGNEGKIDITSFSISAHNNGSFHDGGQGGTSGKASISDVTFTKKVDKASGPLIAACASGKHIPKAKMFAQKAAGKKSLVYYTLELTDVLVSSIANSGSAGDEMHESVSLNFAQMNFNYVPQKKDGTADGAVKAGFNAQKNKEV